jgi:hypothetical protein
MNSNNNNNNTNSNNNNNNVTFLNRRRGREENIQPNQMRVRNVRRHGEEFRGEGYEEEEEVSENITDKSLEESEPMNFRPLPSDNVSVVLSGQEFNHMRNEIIALKRDYRKIQKVLEENERIKD